MEFARPLPPTEPVAQPVAAPVEHAEPSTGESPLAHARLHRKLTLEETAKRAGISADELRWLEEGRLYRFANPDAALLATVLVASALGVEHREALELAGLPVPPKPAEMSPLRRLLAVAAVGAAVLALTLAIVLAAQSHNHKVAATTAKVATLPPPWAIKVVVLNGSGDIVWTRSIASRIQAMSYRVTHVGKASSFTYPQTQVYFPPGGQAIGMRLARQLDAPLQPLPGGADPHRLLVIVGPRTGP